MCMHIPVCGCMCVCVYALVCICVEARDWYWAFFPPSPFYIVRLVPHSLRDLAPGTLTRD